MKAPKYNRSRVMKMAWRMFKMGYKVRKHILTFAECIKDAWNEEKKLFEKAMTLFKLNVLVAEQTRKQNEGRNISTSSMAFMSDTLVNYYENNTYNGD